jgi:hypothetical protein
MFAIGDMTSSNVAQVHTIDTTTGVATVCAPLSGSLAVPFVFAISPAGTAIAIGGDVVRLHKLDLATGVSSFHGQIQNMPSGGYFTDLAFDNSGQLWGSMWTSAGPSVSGVYSIDLGSLMVARLPGSTTAYQGLAFVPAPHVVKYCTAKVNSLGCTPAIKYNGIPSSYAITGFAIWAEQIRNNKAGLLFYNLNGGQSGVPFQGGMLCVRAPIQRSTQQYSGGTPPPIQDCSGRWSLDFNAFLRGQDEDVVPAATVPPGSVVFAQWWGRDPGFAPPNNSCLTDAIEFTMNP